MSGTNTRVKVAVVQTAPVFNDKAATIEKIINLISETGSEKAELILFPEASIPLYPRGLSFGAVVGSRTPEGRAMWQRYWENSVDVPGSDTEIIGKAARETGAYVAIGVIERDSQHGSRTLYCTLLYFGPDGKLLGKHRKLMPTGSERLIWGQGDGSTLTVIDTPFGRIGGLICWENYMPMARMTLYGKGVEIYLAPTADGRDTWQSTMRHIACEGRCFVLGCNQYVTKNMYPADYEGIGELANMPEVLSRGGSVIVSPLGEILEGPMFDREGILYADLDMGEILRGKFDFDVAGHYARTDVFRLMVNEQQMPPVCITDDGFENQKNSFQ